MHKGTIKDMVVQLEENYKETNLITDETAQFWGSEVQDEQLKKLST